MSGFRLSPQQRRLFELSAVGGERLTAGAAFRITGELDLDRFRHAVALLLERFEILTTGFPRVPGLALPVQRPGARVDAEVACAAVDSLAQGERAWRRLFPASEPVADAPPPVRLLLESRGEREHLLVWTQPALLGDAASLGNQVDELLRLYRSTDSPGSGDADPGAEPPLQYADLAEWLNEVVEDEAAAEGPAFWEARSGAATPPPFPLLRADVGERFEPRLCPLPLTADTQAALRRHATDLGLELEALLHAAWAALLTRYADGAPLSVDTLFDGRSYEGLDDAVGLFARYLPIRCEARDAETIGELAARLTEECAAQAEWQEYFVPARPEAGGRATAYGFSYFDLPPRASGDLRVEVEATQALLEPHVLELVCLDRGADAQLRLGLVFDHAALAERDAAAVASAFAALCDDLTRHPARPLDELSLVADDADGALEAPEAPEVAAVHVGELIRRQATDRPDRVAVICGEDALTYGRLWSHAGAVAGELRALGVGTDDVVGVCCERSLDLLVALVGVLRSGGAYLPLDPANPDERLALLARDAGVGVVIHHGPTGERLAAIEASAGATGGRAWTRLDLAAIRSHPDNGDGEPSGDDEAPPGDGDDLAYVIYTSGSTGTPKGVAVTHANLAHSTAARLAFYPGPPERFLLLSSYAFDSSVVGLFWTLTTGGTLVVPEEGTEQDVGLIAATIERLGVTHTLCLPSLYALLLEAASDGEAAPGESPTASSLEVVIVAGEACPAALARRHFQRRPETLLVNEYGPTEATVWATAARLTPESIAPSVPIGDAVPHATVHLLDPSGRRVPPGIAGEIHIGGAGVARGYLGLPELTAERFVRDPFSRRPGARLYRTGDRGRRRGDRQIEFLGRLDHQIKLRGYRIEPGEIEARLLAHPALHQAVVVARAGDDGEPRLVAYLVASNGEPPSVTELRAALLDNLPEYMIPAAFVILDELPLTATGKIDRAALPEPGQGRPDLAAEYVPPRGPVETHLAERWKEVLGTDRVGARDNFFELGGNSIQAAVFMNRIRGEIDEFVHVGRLFELPTVRELAAYLEREHGEAVGRLGRDDAPPSAARAEVVDVSEQVAEMSDEEVDSMLEQLLSEQERGA